METLVGPFDSFLPPKAVNPPFWSVGNDDEDDDDAEERVS